MHAWAAWLDGTLLPQLDRKARKAAGIYFSVTFCGDTYRIPAALKWDINCLIFSTVRKLPTAEIITFVGIFPQSAL